jgi:hypothetical protein
VLLAALLCATTTLAASGCDLPGSEGCKAMKAADKKQTELLSKVNIRLNRPTHAHAHA